MNRKKRFVRIRINLSARYQSDQRNFLFFFFSFVLIVRYEVVRLSIITECTYVPVSTTPPSFITLALTFNFCVWNCIIKCHYDRSHTHSPSPEKIPLWMNERKEEQNVCVCLFCLYGKHDEHIFTFVCITVENEFFGAEQEFEWIACSSQVIFFLMKNIFCEFMRAYVCSANGRHIKWCGKWWKKAKRSNNNSQW